MATGRGAALGVDLWTKARVALTDRAGVITGRNLTWPNEGSPLIEAVVRRVLRKFQVHSHFGAVVETQSNIPTAAGLKSSSAASNAIALATLGALGRRLSDIQTVKLGVEASLAARVSLTGAFDDACACYFGGLVVTDNTNRRILKRFAPEGRLEVLIHVPRKKMYTKDVNPNQLKKIRGLIQVAHQEALKGDYWSSLTLNGLAYSLALGYDTSPVKIALEAGAVAAGLSGKGPAIAAVVPRSKVKTVLSAWNSFSGKVIKSSLNYRKARCVGVAS
jgi:shikimate kinase